MTQIPTPVRDVLDDPVDEATVHRLWRRVGERRVRHWRGDSRRAVGWAVAGGVALAAAAALAFFFTRPTDPAAVPPAPGRLVDGRPFGGLEAVDEPRAVRMDDGTLVRAARGAVIEPRVTRPDLFEAHLARGEATFDVAPGERFRIDCGIATVEVLGTRFAITREPRAVRVRVERGRVRVTDHVATRTVTLGAGQEATVREPEVESDPETEAAAPVEPETEVAAPVEPAAARRGSRWRDLAAAGEMDAAWRALGPEGVEARTRRGDPETLWALADVARRSGHAEAAVEPLRRLLDEHPRDSRAPLAAYTLGTLLMDRLQDARGAARVLERARALGLPAGLDEHALGRLAVARDRAGDEAGARAAAREYLDRYPQGSRVDAIRRVLAEDP